MRFDLSCFFREHRKEQGPSESKTIPGISQALLDFEAAVIETETV